MLYECTHRPNPMYLLEVLFFNCNKDLIFDFVWLFNAKDKNEKHDLHWLIIILYYDASYWMLLSVILDFWAQHVKKKPYSDM